MRPMPSILLSLELLITSFEYRLTLSKPWAYIYAHSLHKSIRIYIWLGVNMLYVKFCLFKEMPISFSVSLPLSPLLLYCCIPMVGFPVPDDTGRGPALHAGTVHGPSQRSLSPHHSQRCQTQQLPLR